LLDRDELLVFFQGEWTREGAREALAVADVAWVAWKLDGGLSVQTWPRDRARTVRELTARLGKKQSGQALAERREPRPVSSLEWRIVDALIDDPRRPLQELTEATGLSPKTVRKHLERLLREELLFITPRLGSLGDSGELVYTTAVFGAVPMADVRRALGDVFLINELQEPPARFLLCRGIDLGDVTTRIARVGKLPGILSVNVSLNREIIVSPDLQRLEFGSIHDLVLAPVAVDEPNRDGQRLVRRVFGHAFEGRDSDPSRDEHRGARFVQDEVADRAEDANLVIGLEGREGALVRGFREPDRVFEVGARGTRRERHGARVHAVLGLQLQERELRGPEREAHRFLRLDRVGGRRERSRGHDSSSKAPRGTGQASTSNVPRGRNTTEVFRDSDR